MILLNIFFSLKAQCLAGAAYCTLSVFWLIVIIYKIGLFFVRLDTGCAGYEHWHLYNFIFRGSCKF